MSVECDGPTDSFKYKNNLNKYSLRLKISVAVAFRETTLTKYILKNINIYDT
jgi:hypothetical protein